MDPRLRGDDKPFITVTPALSLSLPRRRESRIFNMKIVCSHIKIMNRIVARRLPDKMEKSPTRKPVYMITISLNSIVKSIKMKLANMRV